MKIKYSIIIILLVFSVYITCACSNRDTATGTSAVNVSKGESEATSTIGGKSHDKAGGSALKAPGTAADTQSESFFSVDFDYEKNSLTLTDKKLNRLINSVHFEKNSYAKSILKFNQGYAVLAAYADTPVEVSVVNGLKFINYPGKITGYKLRIFDSGLKQIRETDMADIMPESLLKDIHGTAVSQNGEKIIWSFLQQLYIFDIPSGKLKKVYDEKNNNICFSQLSFTKNSDVVFAGSSSQEDEGDCIFGWFSPEDGKMTVNTEKKYAPGSIHVNKEYAWLCDYVDARSQTSSGRILLLDLTAHKAFTMKVDGTESTMARVSEDGKYLIAVKKAGTGRYRIRQYKLVTGEVLKEESIKTGADAFQLEYTGESNRYLLICAGEHGKLAYYYFTCEGK